MKDRKFFDKVGKIEGIQKTIKCLAKATNALFKLSIEFTKNPVSIYDETTLKIAFCPTITFPLTIQSISVCFSDESLDKTIANSVEFKANEELSYEMDIYINSAIKDTITLRSVLLTVQLPEYSFHSQHSDALLELEAEPLVVEHDFARNLAPSRLPLLLIAPPAELVTAALVHRQPAFLGEMYPLSATISKNNSYEITNLMATFREQSEDVPRDKQTSRKASVVSADSNDEDAWSYHLYAALDNEVQRLTSHEHNVTALADKNAPVQFCVLFREERRMNFELVLRYTARKVLKSGEKAEEFAGVSKTKFYVDVFCPFVLASEWINPYCCMSEQEREDKVCLPVGEKILLGVKITAGSFPLVTIHNIQLKIKDSELIRSLTEEANDWQLTLGLFESFSTSFCVETLQPFDSRQVADVEILWSRADGGRSKILCSIPVPQVSAVHSCVALKLVDVPDRVEVFREFAVRYKARNTTMAAVEAKAAVSDNKDFFLTGDMQTKIIIPPQQCEDILFSMYPLKSGKFYLPGVMLSIVTGANVSEKVLDSTSRYAIYVFPS